MSHSEELRAKVRLAEPGLLEVSEHFWTHPQMADMFPEYLFMMHSIIRSSVSLINSAAESAEERGLRGSTVLENRELLQDACGGRDAAR